MKSIPLCLGFAIFALFGSTAWAKPCEIPVQTMNVAGLKVSLLCSPSKWLTITTCKAGVTLSNPPLANRLGWSANSPRHEQNETPARPLPHYGKIRKTEFFKWGFVFSPTL